MRFFLLAFLLSSTVHAEYRVFTLMIANDKTNENRQFDSTLDPDQYKTYYPLGPDEKISYLQTWRCRGRTSDFKTHCLKPQQN